MLRVTAKNKRKMTFNIFINITNLDIALILCYNCNEIISKGSFTMTQITKDMTIGSILDENRDLAPFFLQMGMHCLGCPSARNETVAQACLVHGVNADELVANINGYLADNA